MPLKHVQLRVKRMARDTVLDQVYVDRPVQQLLQYFLARAAEIYSQYKPDVRTGRVKFKDVLFDPDERLKSNESGNEDNARRWWVRFKHLR